MLYAAETCSCSGFGIIKFLYRQTKPVLLRVVQTRRGCHTLTGEGGNTVVGHLIKACDGVEV